jgi:nucleoside phosphorylase
MLGIVFTTTNDAVTFVREHTNGRVEALGEDAPIQTDDLLLAVTGPGKIKATLAAERVLREHDLDALVHTGTCTALNENLSPGTVAGASFVVEGDRVELDAPTYPRMPLECPFDLKFEGTIVSQDHTSDDPDEMSYWERIADVRDETSYAIAYVAAQHGTPCYVAKVVEASADEDTDTGEAAPSEPIAALLQRTLEDRDESVT